MAKIESPERAPAGAPRLGVSACLLGQPVRYDGTHRRDGFLVDALGPFVEWVPVCPEVELGLGVPRPTLHLAGSPGAPRLVVTATGEDLTARMRSFAEARTADLARMGLDGYVFKSRSPSCGVSGVPVAGDGGRGAGGSGLFAAAVARRLPGLPVEEEGRLADPDIREAFVERVFAHARWRRFAAGRPRPADLVAFHARQKFLVLAHSPRHYARLGRLVAAAGPRLDRARLDEYGALFMDALAVPATRGRHVNALQHLLGMLADDLGARERAAVDAAIEDYRGGRAPREAPLALIRHHARRLRRPYVAEQAYLGPYPPAAALRGTA